MKALVLLALLASCGEGHAPEPDAGPDCGPPPVAPYPTTLTYDTGTVTMTDADWQAVVVFRDRALNWFACTEGR